MGLSCAYHFHAEDSVEARASHFGPCVEFSSPSRLSDFDIFITGATHDELQAIADAINAPLRRMRHEIEQQQAAQEIQQAAE